METLLAAAGAGVLLAVGVLAYSLQRRARERRDAAALSHAVERNLQVPPSLHPVIDPDVCIGSLSCLKACPEGDILGVVDGAARLIRGANCVGHGRCARECPVGAIKLVFGTSERGVDLPEVDEHFESSRPGVHVVGELGGMGLIRNAVAQGLQVAEFLAERLARAAPPGAGGPETVDVAVVGSGPAGLAAALGLRQAGRTFRVLEQGTLGGTMAQYPRRKVVMTGALQLPFVGRVARETLGKEELIHLWRKATDRAGIRVEEGVRVQGIEGSDGAFTVITDRGPVSARKVVLATGRRGSPRRLGVPGEESFKVTYRLLDPEQYRGERLLVVGGGDSAVEAAIALAEAGAEVALSYRNAELARCREANRQRFEALAQAGRIRPLMPSTVTEIRPREVLLDHAGAPLRLPNDFVVVSIGGELPLEFLSKAGIQVRRFHGELPAPEGPAREKADPELAFRRRLAVLLGVLGAAILALLALRGWDYYPLAPVERLRSSLHPTFKSAGTWGHGVGIVATGFMLANFLYSARKRLSLLKGGAPIRTWLTFHMFVGFMSPLVIAFHAAFQARNGIAVLTWAALLVVVTTGVIGRFIFGLVPARSGAALELAEVRGSFERLKGRLEPIAHGAGAPAQLRALWEQAASEPRTGSLLLALAALPFSSLSARLRLARSRQAFDDPAAYQDFRAAFLQLLRLRTEVGFHRSLKRLLSGWRLFHAVLAGLLVLTIAAHIAVSIYFGYAWVFSE